MARSFPSLTWAVERAFPVDASGALACIPAMRERSTCGLFVDLPFGLVALGLLLLAVAAKAKLSVL